MPFPQLTLKDDRSQITIYDNFYQYNFDPKPSVSDTIHLSPQNDHIVVRFLFEMSQEPFDYLIYKGDTVTFSYLNGIPYAKNENSVREKTLNYEYERLMTSKQQFQHTPYSIYKRPRLIAKDIYELLNNADNLKKEYYAPARSFLNDELSFLSGMRDIKEKYPEIFGFYKEKLTYQIAELDFEQNKLNPDSLNKILALNEPIPTNKSYSYFFSFLDKVSENTIVKQAKVISSDNGIVIDYRDVYDRIDSWTQINDFYRKYLLYKYLQKIGDHFSSLDLNTYISKFSSSIGDSSLVKKIQEEFPAAYTSTSLAEDSLYMFDYNNSMKSMQEFLRSCEGNVVYIDFWASWCLPCRKEMKYAEALREKFKNENVVFAYFSTDKNKVRWVDAFMADKLGSVEHNYVLMNVESSTFLKSIDFSSIPRYLLFDKFGNLAHKNAPGPSSDEIQHLITFYLKE